MIVLTRQNVLPFVNKVIVAEITTRGKGQPITEYLPENHDGRQIYGIVTDPTPDQGRALRGKAAEREKERQERPS